MDRTDFSTKRTIPRYVFLESDYNSELINLTVVSNGWGKSQWDDKDIHFKELLNQAQEMVYRNPLGAWEFCAPKLLNAETSEPSISIQSDCKIKGTVSGTKSNPASRYHTPFSPWYTRITKPKYCFLTESEALGAGFLKVK